MIRDRECSKCTLTVDGGWMEGGWWMVARWMEEELRRKKKKMRRGEKGVGMNGIMYDKVGW